MRSKTTGTGRRHLTAVPGLVATSTWTEVFLLLGSSQVTIIDPTWEFGRVLEHLIQPNNGAEHQGQAIVVHSANAALMVRTIARVVPLRAWTRSDTDDCWRSHKLPGPAHHGPITLVQQFGEDLMLGDSSSLQKLLSHLNLPPTAQLHLNNPSAPTAAKITRTSDPEKTLTTKQVSNVKAAIRLAATAGDVHVAYL